MPSQVISNNTTTGTIESIEAIEGVNRSCKITAPKIINTVPSFKINSQFIAYASPDSTYAVTRRLLDDAKDEILIGIYDFTAPYMKQILLNAMQRGVKVS